MTYNKRLGVGGGVGMYIRQSLKFKVREDKMEWDNQLEHLWIEVEDRIQYNNILVCVVYQSTFTNNWNKTFLRTLILTGYMNIHLLKPTDTLTKKDQSQNLHKHTSKPISTRPYFVRPCIGQFSTEIKVIGILPAGEVSDHDAPYKSFDTRLKNNPKMNKFIWNLKSFEESKYISDFQSSPFSTVFSLYDQEEKLSIFNF